MVDNIFDNKRDAAIKADIFSEAFDAQCPFLGLEHDPATILGYPDLHNRCFRHKSASSVPLPVQSSLCLNSQFAACPIYQETSKSDDEEVHIDKAIWIKRARPVAIVLPLILLLIAALIWWPTPGTTVEENTSKAAPLQKVVNPQEAPDAIEENVTGNEIGGTGSTNSTEDSMRDSMDESEPSADSEDSAKEKPGGFRVRIYD